MIQQEKNFNAAISLLSKNISEKLFNLPKEIKKEAQEIRLRVNKPTTILGPKKLYFIGPNGVYTQIYDCSLELLSQDDIEENFQKICEYSIYSHQNEIKNGYITIKGGHRVGIAGTAITTGKDVVNLRDITSLNIRISRQILGSADKILEQIDDFSSGILIVGKPSCGKTTILRDLARQLSIGTKSPPKKVTIIDERGEISAINQGVPQNDIGLCDVLNHFSKKNGAILAIRSLSPEFLIFDELGDCDDIVSITEILNAGVSIVASIHASDEIELMRRKYVNKLFSTNAFKYIVFLKSHEFPGEISKILNLETQNFANIYQAPTKT